MLTLKKTLMAIALSTCMLPSAMATGPDSFYLELTPGNVARIRADVLMNLMEQGFEVAFKTAAASTLSKSSQVKFSYGSVGRDIFSRANPYATLFAAISSLSDGSSDIRVIAVDATLNALNAAIFTSAQEFMQLHLQDKYGMSGNKAKAAALGLVSAEIGAWQFYLRPYITKSLAKYFKENKNNPTIRDLLTIDSTENFEYIFKHRIGNFKVAENDRGDIIKITGNSKTFWNTSFSYKVDLRKLCITQSFV